MLEMVDSPSVETAEVINTTKESIILESVLEMVNSPAFGTAEVINTTNEFINHDTVHADQESDFKISDLLEYGHQGLTIREDRKKGVYVDGLSEWVVRSPSEIYRLMEQGSAVRATGETKMNEISSRSHAVFIVVVEQSETIFVDEAGDQIGKLNLVDLAGSERVRLSGAVGVRLEESKQINKSLAALGNVISALTENSRPHIPYRDSKLTRILADSLGGNCRTAMIALISPALECMGETLSTLKFANRAKSIKLLEVDELRRRAEEDKVAAMRALEIRSQEFLREKEMKKQLEEKIASLMSQMIGNTASTSEGFGSDISQQQIAVKLQHEKLRQEYEVKLAELEKERETIEEEKAQVDRYKLLLLKQRDIMIALTQRLVERDEQIVNLQDELETSEQSRKDAIEKLDEKTTKLIQLQRVVVE
ncbi:unnamed protein product, partial [Sphagnum compactum]